MARICFFTRGQPWEPPAKDFQNSKNLSVEAKAAPAKSKGTRAPDWLLLDSEPEAVKTEVSWQKLLGDADESNKTFWLKSRIGICLEALAATLPKFTEKDLLVCHRRNNRGVWKDELWAQRPFGAEELVFAPLVDQIRTSHLTSTFCAAVGLPLRGPGAHPEGSSLALDGRVRQSCAAPGSVDTVKHVGLLFYLVERTVDECEANMSLDTVTWDYTANISLPLKKSKQAVEWSAQDLPNLPILVNKKALKEHTRLVVHQSIPRRQSGEPRSSKEGGSKESVGSE